MEDRVVKSGLDVCHPQKYIFNPLMSARQKAKCDNKFFAAMRDKEAIENERKNLTRNLEKQGKVVERLVETERNLSAQVVRTIHLIPRTTSSELFCTAELRKRPCRCTQTI